MKDYRSIEDLARNLFQLSVHYVPDAAGPSENISFAESMFREFVGSMFKEDRKTTVYRQNHFIGFLAVPDLSGNRICVFGPALLMEVSDFSKSGLDEQYAVRHSRRTAFFAYLKSLPFYPYDELISIAVHLYAQINGSALDETKVRIVDRNWQRASSQRLLAQDKHPVLATEDYAELHQTQQIIYHCIREGDPKGLSREMKNRKMTFHLGMLPTAIDNYKATACMAITLAMQAAIDGGVDTAVALHTYDLFILYLNRLKSIREILNLISAAQQEYAQKVEAIRIPGSYPPILIKVIRHIQQHLYEPLTAKKVAEETHTSQTYISKLFSKHTGMSAGEYIRMKKIREAQRLLLETNASISSIAYQLSFSSQSQFQKAFKRCTGQTPQQFRLASVESPAEAEAEHGSPVP